jgi:hypothetical protein
MTDRSTYGMRATGKLRFMDGLLEQEFEFRPANIYDPNLTWVKVPSFETPDVKKVKS